MIVEGSKDHLHQATISVSRVSSGHPCYLKLNYLSSKNLYKIEDTRGNL